MNMQRVWNGARGLIDIKRQERKNDVHGLVWCLGAGAGEQKRWNSDGMRGARRGNGQDITMNFATHMKTSRPNGWFIQSFGRRIDTMILQFYFRSFHGCLMINMCFSTMCSHSAVVFSSSSVIFCSAQIVFYYIYIVCVCECVCIVAYTTIPTHSTRERLNEVLRIRININIAAINLRFSHHPHSLASNKTRNGWNIKSEREILIKLTLILSRKYKQFQQH